ncbi:MAG: hypothetical protein LLG14_12620 [Nocardiaceae bacterium]|nr:hypothetical protein [Nocardiaceae bacterium]
MSIKPATQFVCDWCKVYKLVAGMSSDDKSSYPMLCAECWWAMEAVALAYDAEGAKLRQLAKALNDRAPAAPSVM